MRDGPGPFWDAMQGRVPLPRRGGELVFLEASLVDAEGVAVATTTATARVIALRDAPTAA